jgi:uncharacterized protein DUF4038/uncharacterized protein DUF5060
MEAQSVPQFAMHEVEVRASADYANPYVDLVAEVTLSEPDGSSARTLPLFWDGGNVWRFRCAPDKPGQWKWHVKSTDPAQNGKSGAFTVEKSDRPGSIRPMTGFPHHFERQDGSRFWFMGDTAWTLYNDSKEEKLDRAAALHYIDARAEQGFNVLHSSLLSEAGWNNSGGPPFHDISGEKINPAYWKEVDHRLAYANSKGFVCGLALAWGDKQRKEPYAWRKFPSLEARKRYARYIAARYAAYNVYFIVAGEWHAEAHTRNNVSEAQIKREFIEIGDALHAADAHGRMKAIHPMTSHGSVREFNEAQWMTFADYQQNYRDLHARILESRSFNKPIVNSEYGYFLRDQSGDGVPDKDNSASIESMRYATWDIAMAGGYVVTGFGTTYYGGNRDPGPFDVEAKKNDEFEAQMSYIERLFTSLEWWKLQPADKALTYSAPRDKDGRELNQIAPPKLSYWCLSEAGRQYVLYVRGIERPIIIAVEGDDYKVEEWNPRTGKYKNLPRRFGNDTFSYRPPDGQDWVVVLRKDE